MTQNASFIRKIVYCCAIVVLLFPLFLLGQPATSSRNTAADAGQAQRPAEYWRACGPTTVCLRRSWDRLTLPAKP